MTNETLKKWYYKLSASDSRKAREAIIRRCGIVSRNVFYNWLNGRTRIPITQQYVIDQIIKEWK